MKKICCLFSVIIILVSICYGQLPNGGYPYANSTPDIPDPWGFLTRECTSYAAWKFGTFYGVPFINTRPGSGSAYNWANLAHDQGYQTSSTLHVKAVVLWGYYPGLISHYGHVAWVERMYSPTDIVVSEYNWNRFSYSERRIDPNSFGAPNYIYTTAPEPTSIACLCLGIPILFWRKRK